MKSKLIDKYWELRREIINTPPIYFLKLSRLFREYKEVERELNSLKIYPDKNERQ